MIKNILKIIFKIKLYNLIKKNLHSNKSYQRQQILQTRLGIWIILSKKKILLKSEKFSKDLT